MRKRIRDEVNCVYTIDPRRRLEVQQPPFSLWDNVKEHMEMGATTCDEDDKLLAISRMIEDLLWEANGIATKAAERTTLEDLDHPNLTELDSSSE